MVGYGVLILFFCILFGYLFGSIPNGLIISKVFFKLDVREYGSHNIGGTNAGRVMGKKVGMIVILLDMIKMIIPLLISFFVLTKTNLNKYCLASMPEISYYSCALFVVIGHCYPIFAAFKGGKAVACTSGSLISTSYICFPAFLISFLLTLKIRKMVSLGSIVGTITATIISLLVFVPSVSEYITYPGFAHNYTYVILLFLETTILIIRHRNNIKRIKKNEESKISWMK